MAPATWGRVAKVRVPNVGADNHYYRLRNSQTGDMWEAADLAALFRRLAAELAAWDRFDTWVLTTHAYAEPNPVHPAE